MGPDGSWTSSGAAASALRDPFGTTWIFACDPPQFEDVFPLLVVEGDLADGLAEADGNFSVVRDAVAGALVVLVEPQAALPQHAVNVLPRSVEGSRGSQFGFTPHWV